MKEDQKIFYLENLVISNLNKRINKFKKIKKKKIEFTWYKVLKPSERPHVKMRSGYAHMYVPRATEDAKQFEEFCKGNNLPKIETPCIKY